MTDPIAEFLAKRISAPVALARLALSGASREELARRLASAPGAEPLSRLLSAQRANLDRLGAMTVASGIDHGATGPDALAMLRAGFDRAASVSPEASVAAYSLGDPELLNDATAELVAWLNGRGLLAAERDVLDLGCGIGRIAAAIAPLVRSVRGLDIAPGMIAAARRRCTGLANVRLELTDGSTIALAPDSIDLVLAVDTMPYLVQVDVADRHVAGAARALRAGGTLAIFNLSYGEPSADRARAEAWRDRHGLVLDCTGERPFALWDGAAFLLRKSPAAASGSASS